MVFAVGAFYGAPDAEIERRPAGWLYDRHQRVARERYDRSAEMGVTLETAVLKALARQFGGKDAKLPDWPTWDEAVARQQSDGPAPSPEWWAEYAAANRGRVKL